MQQDFSLSQYVLGHLGSISNMEDKQIFRGLASGHHMEPKNKH